MEDDLERISRTRPQIAPNVPMSSAEPNDRRCGQAAVSQRHATGL